MTDIKYHQTGVIRKIFGMVKAYEKSTGPRHRYWSITPKQDDNDSDWNDNLYTQNYRANPR